MTAANLAPGKDLQRLRSRIVHACRVTVGKLAELEAIEKRLDSRERTLFVITAQCIENRSQERAAAFAQEVSQIRGLESRIKFAKIGVEAAVIRLSAMSDYIDFVDTMNPVRETLLRIGGIAQVGVAAFDLMSQVSCIAQAAVLSTDMYGIERIAKTAVQAPLDDGTMAILREAEMQIEKEALANLPMIQEDKKSAIIIAARITRSENDGQLLA